MRRLESAKLGRDIGTLFETGTLGGLSDGQRLERFTTRGDEVAFEELIARHGPIVLRICRRWLDDPPFRIMLVIRIQTAILVVLALGTLAWSAPALLSARPAEQARIESKSKAAPITVAPLSQPPRTDRYGDPLPPGAAMRLGTARYRQVQEIKHIVYSPDGQIVATDNGLSRLQVWDARDGKTLRQIDLEIEDVRDFVFSPDGKRIAIVGFQLEPKRDTVVSHLIFTDIATGRQVQQAAWDEQYEVRAVAYAPDGKTVATVNSNGSFRVWDAATTRLLLEGSVGNAGSLSSIAFSPDAASRLLAVAWNKTIDLWDVASLRRVRSIAIDGKARPECLAFSPDGATLAAGDTAWAEIRLSRVSDGTLLRRFKSKKNTSVSHISFSADGRMLAAMGTSGGLFEGPLALFDVETAKELDQLSDLRVADGPLAFSPDEKTLAATGDRQTLHFWELSTGKDRLATPDAHQGGVAALAFLADGKTLISGSHDRTARIWDLATGRPTRILPYDTWTRSLSVSADGSLLATGSAYPEWGQKVQFRNLKTGDLLRTWSVAEANTPLHLLRGVTLSGDDSSVIAALSDGTLRRWDVATGNERPMNKPKLEKLPRTGMGGINDVDRAVFSRDGRSVAMIGEEWVQIIDVASGDRRFKALSATRVCEFAPDGKSLAIIRRSPGKKIRAGTWRGSLPGTSTIVWLDSQTGNVRREIEIPECQVNALVFSPDGHSVAVGTLLRHPIRGIIRIFRLRDKHEIHTIESPCAFIDSLCFTPDGKQLVAGLQDTSIVIWIVRPTD